MNVIWSKEFVSVDHLHYVEVRVYAAEPPWLSFVRLTIDEEPCLTAVDVRELARILVDAALIAEIESADLTETDAREAPVPDSYLSKKEA